MNGYNMCCRATRRTVCRHVCFACTAIAVTFGLGIGAAILPNPILWTTFDANDLPDGSLHASKDGEQAVELVTGDVHIGAKYELVRAHAGEFFRRGRTDRLVALSGFPMYCLYGVLPSRNIRYSGGSLRQTLWLSAPTDDFVSVQTPWGDAGLVPCRISWWKLGINVGCWYLLLWACTSIPGSVRRVLRIRRGRCAECGYPMVPGMSSCPECGSEVKASAITRATSSV